MLEDDSDTFDLFVLWPYKGRLADQEKKLRVLY